ncbi:MAG: ribosomal RNA small subunit methyltransferase I [Leptospiraceae bacterium]|nr:MAG: ribosomal RNA small subunit methyltransferase I [Leptospiraceae bacterium]
MDTEIILEKPALYVIATPIGNLKDITIRAIETLKLCDLVLSEDTRKSKILFQKYEIHTPLKSFRVHQINDDILFAINQLKDNKALGFITDAGTPGISDPVSHLIRYIRENYPDIPIIPIPGPSAISTALSISGWQTNPSLFLGFLSNKSTRRFKTLQKYKDFEGCIIIFESVHRIYKLIEDIFSIFPERQILIAREMTKKFEDYIILDYERFSKNKQLFPLKGEFTVIISPLK